MMTWMTAVMVSALLVPGEVPTRCPAEQGLWTADGETFCVPCLPAESYARAASLPQGCPGPIAGVLMPEAEFLEANKAVAEFRAQADSERRLRLKAHDAKKMCEQARGQQARQCALDLKNSRQALSRATSRSWTDFLWLGAAFVAGALVF
ncbi:MAG: hypothetical protein ACE366_16420 [Bradymonadia bacterium]